ncbi:leucine-rich repeat domain-containing protein [Anaeromicropila populeti]|uniref:Leucine rich repeat-containing protein n=1 Tax=Anaeromicropila populeti TaxID=37658 RepID=A0A1I6IR24_9FIRM|nr:leucine-rich repeat domain-containing protein [Anaeromicropila populeti]SFR69202.1 Leucine rich repeat-containing protein [Anaeromicropila populeti]
MKNHFEWKIVETGIEITRYLGDASSVIIPEKIDEQKVVSLAAYAFERCRGLYELFMPDGLLSIGTHAFYNCRELRKIVLYNTVNSIGDGAFKNCGNLKEVFIYRVIPKTKCLKGILSEINQELHVTLDYGEDKWNGISVAKLVFPKYEFDYEEVTAARIINQVTYGSGVHFRECMFGGDVDYKKYDADFFVARANDSDETAAFLAMYRAFYPYKLEEEAQQMYLAYIKENLDYIFNLAAEREDMEILEQLSKLEVFDRESLERILKAASSLGKLEIIHFLLTYKKRKFGFSDKSFEL